jgi:hypothetical protein
MLIGAAVVLLTACADPVEDAAQAACACLEPVYADLEKMTQAMQSGNMAELSNMAANMDTAQKTQVCLNKVSHDYPDIGKDQESQNRFQARMGEICPMPQMGGI